MKRAHVVLAATLTSAMVVAFAGPASPTTVPSSPAPLPATTELALVPTMDFALGAASELPSARLLGEIAGAPSTVGSQLIAIGMDDTRTAGVRLRALASLTAYPSAAARDAMRVMLDTYATTPNLTPADVWLVRAALEVLATCGDQHDVLRMAVWLEREDLRDVRARAAWALGRLGQPEGIEVLRKRFMRETVGQVAYQIAQALDVLSE